MIAQKAFVPAPIPKRTAVRAQAATRRRSRRARLRGYVVMARITIAALGLFAPVMVYVLLMANLTGASDALARAQQTKLALQEESTQLDDKLAQLQSRERLAAIAASLHMHEPHVYAVVALPRVVKTPPPDGLAFLGTFFRH